MLDGFKARRKAEIEGHTYLAHLTAGLDRWPKTQYLPTIDQLLKSKPTGKQSTADMLSAFQDFKAAGAPMTIRKVA